MLTCPGETFASRVGVSLLTNIGLPKLIASGLDDYESKAIRLVSASEELDKLRARLMSNRPTWPLFDTARLVRNLERAYCGMWIVYAAGERPGLIRVSEQQDKLRFDPITIK